MRRFEQSLCSRKQFGPVYSVSIETIFLLEVEVHVNILGDASGSNVVEDKQLDECHITP